MRLLLSGGGAGEQAAPAYQKLSGMIDRSKPLLYIPLAMEKKAYPGCLEWITGELEDLQLAGIEMVTSGEELASKQLEDYCAIFIGGGNTYKLLSEIKASSAFAKISTYLQSDGIIFGGSAGAIIFGEDIESCGCDDPNDVQLADTAGFDALNGVSLLCHYTNRSPKEVEAVTRYLLALSDRRKILALPEEDTILIDGGSAQVIGTRPWYQFEKGIRSQRAPGQKLLLRKG